MPNWLDFRIGTPHYTEQMEKIRRGRALFVLGVCAALLFAAFLQYSAFNKGLYSKSADESARTLAAYRLSQQGFSIPVGVWLPGYQLVLGFGLKVWPDLFVMPRVLNNVLGLLTLAVLGWLASILFKNRGAVLLTLLLGAAFGPRIVCSVVTFSEIFFAFLLLTGIAFFARWVDQPRPAWLLIGAGFTTLSAGVRYEGWLFVAGMALISFLIILSRRAEAVRGKMNLWVCACVILCSVPAAWVVLLAVQRLSLWDVFTASGRIYAGTADSGTSLNALWKHGVFYQFFVQNLESLNIFGVFGALTLGIFTPKLRKWLFLPVFAFVVLGILSLAGVAIPAHNYWRSSLVWSLLLIPFCAYWIIEQGKHFGRGRRYVSVLVCALFAVVFLFSFNRQAVTMTRYSHMDRPDINAAKFINSYVMGHGENERPRVFIEWADWHFAHVRVASQCPDAFVNVTWLERIIKRGRIDLVKLRRNNIGLLVVEVNTFYKRRSLFGKLKPAYKNARWVALPVRP